MRGRSSPRKIAKSPSMRIYVEGYTALEQGKIPWFIAPCTHLLLAVAPYMRCIICSIIALTPSGPRKCSQVGPCFGSKTSAKGTAATLE